MSQKGGRPEEVRIVVQQRWRCIRQSTESDELPAKTLIRLAEVWGSPHAPAQWALASTNVHADLKPREKGKCIATH